MAAVGPAGAITGAQRLGDTEYSARRLGARKLKALSSAETRCCTATEYCTAVDCYTVARGCYCLNRQR